MRISEEIDVAPRGEDRLAARYPKAFASRHLPRMMRVVSKAVVSVAAARERAIARLSDHYAADGFDVDEFERRVDLVHQAKTPAELEPILADLPAEVSAPIPAKRALAPIRPLEESQSVVAIIGGAVKRGGWLHARKVRVVTVLGGAEIDLRDVALPSGVTELRIFALMGGVEVIVPPDLTVHMDGGGLMGGFDQMHRTPASQAEDAPILKITGFVCMGGVSVSSRLPGEGRGDARRREKAERKAARLQARERRQLPPAED